MDRFYIRLSCLMLNKRGVAQVAVVFKEREPVLPRNCPIEKKQSGSQLQRHIVIVQSVQCLFADEEDGKIPLKGP
jgi:hypothetical protein